MDSWTEWGPCDAECDVEGYKNRSRGCHSKAMGSAATIVLHECPEAIFEKKGCKEECSIWRKGLKAAGVGIDYLGSKIGEGYDAAVPIVGKGLDAVGDFASKGFNKTSELAIDGYDTVKDLAGSGIDKTGEYVVGILDNINNSTTK